MVLCIIVSDIPGPIIFCFDSFKVCIKPFFFLVMVHIIAQLNYWESEEDFLGMMCVKLVLDEISFNKSWG